MRPLRSVVLAAVIALALTGCTVPDATSKPLATATPPVVSTPATTDALEELFTPIVGSALAPPIAVPATDGLTHLAYELRLTNVLGQPVTIDTLTVRGDGADLLTLDADSLTPWMRPTGATALSRTFGPGQQAIITLDVTVPMPADAPASLSHVLQLSLETPMPPLIQASMTQTVAVTPVSTATPIVIGSPLRGANWFDANSCCKITPHRSAINPVNGQQYAPERFAIDFVQLDDQGRIFNGAMTDLASYDYYGADIVAVGDGPIVSMLWTLPEQPPGKNPTGLELAEYGGNHVVQDLGGGHYAFYAHLQGGNPNDLKVGQQLSRGDVIGALGNSGNTDMPHLHFHIMDSPLPLGSNGLPFLIDSFTLAGTVAENDMFACSTTSVSCNVDTSRSGLMTKISPLYLDVIDVKE